ncbi:phosphoenolpyruvate carboxykinase (ATP)-like [Schistocerca gregaria]|uniref:phosphoenolpyruvate carboxykinase (ATP)-like n=1 Tax=Schistocerca gregaria TaxID=7010 RepID=UPI00211EB709|nr:phosphoenolpyruvate carboxykinase (ATP)-like [Schistocerca gregaria]
MYYVQSCSNNKFSFPKNLLSLDDTHFRSLGILIANSISEAERVYVLDACLGSHRLGQQKVRIITDSANIALYFRHMLVPHPETNPSLFHYNLVVYIATSLKIPNSKEYALTSDSFAASNPERGILLISNVKNTETITDAILAAVGSRVIHEEIPSLPIQAHIMYHRGKSALVIDPSKLLVCAVPEETYFNGFHSALWNSHGVFHMFGGVAHQNLKAPRSRGDLVEMTLHGDVTNARVIQPLHNLVPKVPPPTTLVFVIRDITGILPGLAKLAPQVASKYLAAGYGGKPNQLQPFYFQHRLVSPFGKLEKLFEELAVAHHTRIYLCNIKRRDGTELTRNEIENILLTSLDNSLDQSPPERDDVLKCDVIKSVRGVSTSLDPLQGWQKDEYVSKAKRFASLIGI